jgi:GNAT superfamily N-acetyltransferase
MTESRNTTPAHVELRQGYEPGLIGRVGELHGRYYAAAWGVGAAFEIIMTRDLCDFIEQYDPDRDIVVSAHIEGVLIGSIAILGEKAGTETAQLRFFLVDPKYQGCGAGKSLLKIALAWCREHGYRKVFLWTVDHLPQSRQLYEKAGFRVTTECMDDRYSAPLKSLKMECSLDLKSNPDATTRNEYAVGGSDNPS